MEVQPQTLSAILFIIRSYFFPIFAKISHKSEIGVMIQQKVRKKKELL